MKILFTAVIAGACVFGSASAMAQETKYGKEFRITNAISMQELFKSMESKSELNNIILEGAISQVCQAEGCWIKLKNEQGEDLLVKFKDHAFLVPKDLASRQVIVNGTAKKKVISVKERQHMAEDAGASKEEIAKITEPKEELRIEATGIIVR